MTNPEIPSPQPAPDDVRELQKWLNEAPNRPIDRAALARVLASQYAGRTSK